MKIWIVILCLLCAGLLIIGLIAFGKLKAKITLVQNEAADDKNKANSALSASEGRNIELREQVTILNQRIEELSRASVGEENLEQLIAAKNDAQAHLNELNELLSARSETVLDLEIKVAALIEAIENKNLELMSAEKGFHEAMERRNELDKSQETIEKVIYDLGLWYRKALIESKNAQEKDNTPGWVFELNENEIRFINTINQVKKLIEGLNDAAIILSIHQALGAAAWKKVWLPKLQIWNKIWGLDTKTNCIYKLTLIEDEAICYIGQAKDLKTRWYTHVKKMTGVESKGDEKLYNYVPNAFRWEVLEEGLETKALNEREHYWINFFGGDVIGLNKKL